MKIIIYFILFIGSLYFVSAWANGRQDFSQNLNPYESKFISKNESLKIDNAIIQNKISSSGNISLLNVTVNGELNVKGTLFGFNVNLNDVYINGRIILSGKNFIDGIVYIIGEIILNNTRLSNKIMANSVKIEIGKGSITKSIYVVKNTAEKRDEYIYIDGGFINGDIIFESGRGHVIISNGGEIAGTIVGGVLSQV